MKPKIEKILREIAFNSSLRKYFFPWYRYCFTPPQLIFLCQCVEDTKDVKGSIAEVGCSTGSTTVFLNKYMKAQKIEKDYFAVDTFSGFTRKDLDFEVTSRGKTKSEYELFQVNKKKWFDQTMGQNRISRVQSIKADVNNYDLKTLGPLSFILLDVDLYRPMKKALPELFSILSPGGIMVVDDCDETNFLWDGSDQAYKEFMKEIGQNIQIVHEKLGIIKKPADNFEA